MPDGNGWHTPGSEAARYFGCRCPVLDNHHGRRGLDVPEAGFIMSIGCPLHTASGRNRWELRHRPEAGFIMSIGCPLHSDPQRDIEEIAESLDEGRFPDIGKGRWPGPDRSRRKPVTEPAFKTFRCTAQRELFTVGWTSSVGVPAFELWAEDEERAEAKARRILGRVKHQVALHVCLVEV